MTRAEKLTALAIVALTLIMSWSIVNAAREYGQTERVQPCANEFGRITECVRQEE